MVCMNNYIQENDIEVSFWSDLMTDGDLNIFGCASHRKVMVLPAASYII